MKINNIYIYLFREFKGLETQVRKIFKNHRVASIQKDESSASIFLNIYREYNRRLKDSLSHRRSIGKNSHLHKPTFYTYIILRGNGVKKLLRVLESEIPSGQGI